MLRLSLLAIFFCLGLYYAKAQSSENSSRSKFVDRVVSAISRDCSLKDSTKRKLSKYFYDHLVELKRIRSINEDKLVCGQKITEVRLVFLNGLKEKFGNDVYKSYKKLTVCHELPVIRKKLNRITERTSE